MKLVSGRRRVAVSDIIGTLIMVAITLVAGAAVFGFVNGQAGNSENQYGQAVANNVNYLREHFVIVNTQFSGCAPAGGNRYCNQVAVSLYNNGNVGLTPKSFTLINTTKTSPSGATVPQMYIVSTASATTAYGKTGTGAPAACGAGVSSGTAYAPLSTVGISSVPPTVFTITLPASCFSSASSQILVGASYQLQILGTFGYVAQLQVTASG